MKKVIFDNVCKTFSNGITVLDHVSFEINYSDSMIILGRSGAGKSVTLKLLLGLMDFDYGDIKIDGISVHDRKRKLEYRSKFSVLFQGCALFDSMTVLENVTFGMLQKSISKNEAKNRAQKMILSVGLDESVFNMYPASISGGMQKRVALARAIALEPEIMLFDEPTSGLDPVTSKKISFLIREILKEIDVTSLTITHDLNVARCFGSRIAMLDNAQILWSGDICNLDSSGNETVQSFVDASKWEK